MTLLRLTVVLLSLLATAVPLRAADDAAIERYQRSGWEATDFTRLAVPLSEIMSGGPPKDGIPSIDDPRFEPVAGHTGLDPREPVIGLEIGGDARAYPLRILTWHEIVNDTVGGMPVTVTYCPLCNAAIVFRREVAGEVRDFGTTGLLRNSDLVMYDRQSQTWWQQFTGEAIVGALTGTELETVPARLESWRNFSTRHPGGKVLVPNDPGLRQYGRNPYAGYDSSARPFLYDGEMPEGISPMARVVVYRSGGETRAVALALLAEKQELGDGDIVLRWTPGQASALDSANIAEGRDVGNITVQRREDGKLADVAYDVTFAFVVSAFRKGTEIRTR